MSPLPSDPAEERGDLLRRIQKLESEMRTMRSERRIAGSTGVPFRIASNVTGGPAGFEVLHDDGSVFVRAGREDTPFGPVDKFVVFSLHGVNFFLVQSNLFGFENWALFDGKANVLIASEANSADSQGQGLARPYFPSGLFETVATPTDTTASGTFTTLQKAIWIKQHKAIKAWVEVQVTATTGEIRWRVNTGPFAGTIVHGPITKSGNTLDSYTFEVPGDHLQEFELELQARVASGSGLVRVRTQTAIGREP
jgi:hypothetical protein